MTSRAFNDHYFSKSGDGSQQSTAFREASHASFLARSASCSHTGTNGALTAAATSAGMGMRRQGLHSAAIDILNSQREERPSAKSAVWSDVSRKDGSPQRRSHSYAAALRATSKPTPISKRRSFGSTADSRQPPTLQNVIENKVSASSQITRSTDGTAGGTMGSVVSHFESKSVPTVHSVRYVTKPASTIASPTTSRPATRPAISTTDSLSTFPLGIELETEISPLDTSSTAERSVAATAAQSASHTVPCTRRLGRSAHPTLLPRIVPEPPARPRLGARAPSDSSLTKARNVLRTPTGCDSSVMPRAWIIAPATASQIPHSDPAFLSSKSSSTSHSRPHLPVRSSRSFEMKVDSLANTIVAASLASSRAPSPAKTPPPPRRHKSRPLFYNHDSQGHTSRTPSPAKVMRQTMREPLSSDDGVESRKRGILMWKHPHKHHEGSRKRYRATVTDRERRRYDGLWAANKGLWMDANSSNNVLNLVVRDIWSRSRLPTDILADIWDLVNIHGRDRLQRSEFIVGMWLIDQRLKGRKLPFTISESVWNSVRLLHGGDVSQR